MFIALVVGILVTCLTCLLWIVVKCAQDQVEVSVQSVSTINSKGLFES